MEYGKTPTDRSNRPEAVRFDITRIVNSEFVSNEISAREKHNGPRIGTWGRMMICNALPEYRINLVFDEFKKKFDLTTKYKLPEAMDSEIRNM
jgi:hypothetical protein